jgi:hypothetical protein
VLARVPHPVQPVQVDVAEQRRCRAALRSPGHLPPHLPAFHHPGAQHRPQQRQDGLVADAFLHRSHQLVVRNRGKAARDVRLDHPPPPLPGLINQDLQGIVRRPLRAEPEAARGEVRLEDRLEHDLHRSLHDPVADRRDRQRPALAAARLGDQHLPRRQRTPRPGPQLGGQLAEQPGHPVLLDVSQGGLVDTRRAVVPAHRMPRPLQDVFAVDLVPQRMKPSSRIGPGRPVKHMLQSADPVPVDGRQGGPSRILGTHLSGSPSSCVNEAAALPSPQVVLSCRSDRYYGRLRLPPGTPPASRLLTGYKTALVHGHRGPLRPGRAPQFPPPPSERSAPRTPDSPSRLHFQDLRRFHGLRRDYRGSALSCPLTTRQASLDATDRSVAPTTVAFDAGLRPGPFPGQTASLLPGSLAITRTGLSPAGDDELLIRS